MAPFRRVALAFALGLGLAPVPAGALTCREWTRLDRDQQVAQIRERIEAAVTNPEPDGLEVDRGALRRCLESNATTIDEDFDDACIEGIEVNLDALDEIFRRYVASCQG